MTDTPLKCCIEIGDSTSRVVVPQELGLEGVELQILEEQYDPSWP